MGHLAELRLVAFGSRSRAHDFPEPGTAPYRQRAGAAGRSWDEESSASQPLPQLFRPFAGARRRHTSKHVGTVFFLLNKRFQAALLKVLDGQPEAIDYAVCSRAIYRR
jgi:hypothetical protein